MIYNGGRRGGVPGELKMNSLLVKLIKGLSGVVSCDEGDGVEDDLGPSNLLPIIKERHRGTCPRTIRDPFCVLQV